VSDRGKPLHCSQCHRPWGYLRDGRLWVWHRHSIKDRGARRNEYHGNSIAPAELTRELHAQAEWYTLPGDPALYHNCVSFERRKPCDYNALERDFTCPTCETKWVPGGSDVSP
jgi:hypothetical protein